MKSIPLVHSVQLKNGSNCELCHCLSFLICLSNCSLGKKEAIVQSRITKKDLKWAADEVPSSSTAAAVFIFRLLWQRQTSRAASNNEPWPTFTMSRQRVENWHPQAFSHFFRCHQTVLVIRYNSVSDSFSVRVPEVGKRQWSSALKL